MAVQAERMKQKTLMFGGLFLIIVAMIGLNAASYVQKDQVPDTELIPKRSTYNSGSTGTKAYYELLGRSGRKVVRWDEPPASLLTSRDRPDVFVMIGPLRRELGENGTRDLLNFASNGGRLVVIDREPTLGLKALTADWNVEIEPRNAEQIAGVDPSDQTQMTGSEIAGRPVHASIYTRGVTAVRPSRFASAITFSRDPDAEDYVIPDDPEGEGDEGMPAEPYRWFAAPVVHISAAERNVVVEVPYGAGRIVYVSDPFIVANGGISMADNVQLAINLVDTAGTIAFDEYHQGFGAGANRIVEYFSGTPIVAMTIQLLAIVGLVLYSRSRRFARPVPAPESDRLTKLEYVSAMAELQRRSDASDLALENIFGDFRRRAAKLFGIDVSKTSPHIFADHMAERTGRDREALIELMQRAEAVMHGDRADKRETVAIVKTLRSIEEDLGLSRAGAGSK
jgi:hypothetical protein